jgi:hypothetical protein
MGSLKTIPKYENKDFIGAENFDNVYRTPPNFTVKDLIPKDYIIHKDGDIFKFDNNPDNDIILGFDKGPKGAVGFYDIANKKIHTVDQSVYEKKYKDKPELLKQFGMENTLIHEKTHGDDYELRKKKVDILKTQLYNSINNTEKLRGKPYEPYKRHVPLIDTEYEAIGPVMAQDKEFDKLFDIFKEKRIKSGLPLKEKGIKEINRDKNELVPYYAGAFPEDVLNPKDKLAKKINRLKFSNVEPMWGMV